MSLTKQVGGLPIITWINTILTVAMITVSTYLAIRQLDLAQYRVNLTGAIISVDQDNQAFLFNNPVLPTWLSLSPTQFRRINNNYQRGKTMQTIGVAIENFGSDYNETVAKQILTRSDYLKIAQFRHFKQFGTLYILMGCCILILCITLQSFLLKP